MSQIMCETDRLHEILVAAQSPRQGAADLGNFQRVGEAGAEVIAFVVDEDLRLVFEASESCGVQDAVAVALERGAVLGFVIQVGASLRVAAPHPIRGEAPVLILL